MAFVIPALVGLLWLLPWLATFPDKERDDRDCDQAGRRAGRGAGPSRCLGQLLTNRKVLGLCLIRVFTGPITTFYWTWLPLYLSARDRRRGCRSSRSASSRRFPI